MAVHEINIYGDIVPFKWFADGAEYDRSDLNDAIDALDLQEGDELIYNLHTFGGCTTTAFSMYNKLKRVKNEKKITLTSRADGYCASSGVILLLAADKRIGSKYLQPFVHNAWTWVGVGDKTDAKKAYEELDKVDNAIAELYSEETTLSKESALQFMSEERDLTLDECVNFGFYTEIENVRVVENAMAFNSIRNKRNQNNNMAETKDSLLKRIENFLKGAKNKIVFTAAGSELDFYELSEDATPAIGDKARFDGKPAGDSNDGEYLIPDVGTYKFTGEELTEIEALEPDDDNEVENLRSEVENLKKEINNLKTEKETISNKLNDATQIITGFKNLSKKDDEDGEDQRDGKPKPVEKTSRIGNAISKLKNKNTNGSND